MHILEDVQYNKPVYIIHATYGFVPFRKNEYARHNLKKMKLYFSYKEVHSATVHTPFESTS